MYAKGAVESVRRFSSFHLLSALLIAPVLLASATAAHAATYTVTNLNDSGTGSLRAAITAANADTAGVIVFASGLKGTITLQSALPNIATTGTMTITGPGANLLTISGANKYQILGFTSGTTNFSGLTFANGTVSATNGYTTEYGGDPGWGGAFYTTKGTTVNVANCVFVGNDTTNGSGGGAILNEGVLTIVNSMFVGNQSPGVDGGGALFNLGTMTVQGSTFAYNYAFNEGSAILNYSDESSNFGVTTISDSTFVNNMVPVNGGSLGAIYNETGATLTLRDSTLAGNLPVVGGGITNAGTMTLSDNAIVEPATGSRQCTALPAPASQCPTFPSSPDANGNFDDVAGNLKLSSLGYYGGLSPTMLPLPGSELLCGATTAGAKDVKGNALTMDERGFGIDPACAAGKVDAGAAQAHYLTVTATSDPGSGTCGATCVLRDAIAEANSQGDADIIFAPAVTGTIKLGSELPTITGEVDIIGPGASVLTVSGNSAVPVFGITTGTLDISGLTIANGKSASNGGGINNTAGLVTLTNAVLTGNSAVSDGGAIDNGGVVLAIDSTISGNKAVLGSAIYNTGAVNLEYSTLAGNAASSSGGIYNNSGGLLTAVNTTFAANTGTGAGIDNLGTLGIENSVLDAAGECAGTGCPTAAGSGNVAGATNLAGLGSYGGPTPTVLPLPGSSAICAGLAANIPGMALTDQRGFANENLTYTGYSSATPCVDAGAVQTNYTSAQFTGTGPFVATVNVPGITPAVVVSVTENGQNIGGVPVPLTFTGAGTATGLTATTVTGTGATYSGLTVSAASAPTDSLAVSMTVVGTDTLTAGPVTLTVSPPVPPVTATVASSASVTLPATSVNLSATVTSGGNPVAEGQVSFTVQSTTVSVPVGANGVATVVFPLAGLGGGTYSVSVAYSDVGGKYNASATTSVLTLNKSTPTISWATPAAITYGTLLSATQLDATASVQGTFLYSPAAGTMPAAGTDTLSVTFTPSDSGDYSTAMASVSLSVTIPPTPIVPYIQVNGASWQSITAVTVAAGSVVNLGPQPLTGGSWSWTGTNGFTSTAREIDGIPLNSGVNTYVATYTNPAGMKSTETFTITVTGWQKMLTSVSNAAVGADGTLVVVNAPNQTIWEYAAGKWTQLPGLAKQVAVVNANSLWCIGTDNNVYRLSGSTWIRVGNNVDSIAAASDGTVLVANDTAQTIWKYVADNSWTQIPTGLANVLSVVRNNDYFVVGSGPGYWAWNYNGSSWSAVGQTAYSWISSASDGTVIATTSGNAIYQFDSANNWTQVTGTMKEVVVQKAGAYYGIGTDGNLYSYGTH